jgi:hypothetical protein
MSFGVCKELPIMAEIPAITPVIYMMIHPFDLTF